MVGNIYALCRSQFHYCNYSLIKIVLIVQADDTNVEIVVCESKLMMAKKCSPSSSRGIESIELEEKTSKSPCIRFLSYFIIRNKIVVKKGCGGRFRVTYNQEGEYNFFTLNNVYAIYHQTVHKGTYKWSILSYWRAQ